MPGELETCMGVMSPARNLCSSVRFGSENVSLDASECGGDKYGGNKCGGDECGGDECGEGEAAFIWGRNRVSPTNSIFGVVRTVPLIDKVAVPWGGFLCVFMMRGVARFSLWVTVDKVSLGLRGALAVVK